MPKGKHKGKHRVFTNPEQLAEEEKREEREREWRQKRGEASSSDEDGSGSGSESSSSDEPTKEAKPKGPQVVTVENPNRVQQKNKKLSSLSLDDTAARPPAQLTRREREALEKERARQHYQKLHAQGKTAEAQSDLARLAIIRKQREDAAKKRDDEKKAKEAAKAAPKR